MLIVLCKVFVITRYGREAPHRKNIENMIMPFFK